MDYHAAGRWWRFHQSYISSLKTVECYFELTKDGAWLKPVAFGSCGCNENEQKLHSFVGEAVCGHLAIAQNRTYLWGDHFFWMCDCSAMKEILEYNSNIPMIFRWAQEILAYCFSVLHWSCKMMIDVDSLTPVNSDLKLLHIVWLQKY